MNLSKELAIRKIAETSWLLERGNDQQVTKLLTISKLIDGEWPCEEYYFFLVDESYKLYRNGASLSRIDLIDEIHKTEIYKRTIFLLKALRETEGIIKHGKDAIDLHNEINSISSGWKRISIHATRRKMEDPDLALLEQVIRFVLNHWYSGMYAYFLSKYFSCDYKGYRFSLNMQSAKRVMAIAEYFSGKLLGGSIRLTS